MCALDILVVFTCVLPIPEAQLPGTPVQVGPHVRSRVVERQRQRAAFFSRDFSSPAQISVEWPKPTHEVKSVRLALEQDFWSTFDTSTDIVIGGKKVSAGLYYVTVDTNQKPPTLTLIESRKARETMQVSPNANLVKTGVRVGLQQQEVEGKGRDLSMSVTPIDRKKPDKLLFRLLRGKIEYTAEVKIPDLPEAMAFVQKGNRSRSILFRGGDSGEPRSSCAVVTIEHGAVRWRPAYQKMIEKAKSGVRWRMGKDFWTSLDTNVPISIAGQKIAPGYYYLLLQKGKDDWSLVVLDHARMHKASLDPVMASKTKGGTLAKLETEPALKKPQQKLSVRLTCTKANLAVLDIRWGTHHLTADMILHSPKPKTREPNKKTNRPNKEPKNRK